jgi:hypothetical protein
MKSDKTNALDKFWQDTAIKNVHEKPKKKTEIPNHWMDANKPQGFICN